MFVVIIWGRSCLFTQHIRAKYPVIQRARSSVEDGQEIRPLHSNDRVVGCRYVAWFVCGAGGTVPGRPSGARIF